MNDPTSQECQPEHELDSAALHLPLKIMLNDDHIVVAVKPAGMSVHRNSDDRISDCYLLQRLRDQTGDWIFPIHRLDRATSGLVVFAKSPEIAAAVSAQFAARQVLKQYVALVRGHTKLTDSMPYPLISMRGRRKPNGHPARQPQEALTEFETVKSWTLPYPSGPYETSRCSLVHVFPKTGRWHQIRRHFNYHSYPVIGDSSHGDTRVNRIFHDRLGIQRLMLMASFLKFVHPITNQPIHLECELDSDFQEAITQINANAIS